jgi:hypothetical protein
MRADPNIKLDATVTITLTEEEARVLGHLCGYDPGVIVQNVTREFSVDVLQRVAQGARGQLETAVERIAAARQALQRAPAQRDLR